MADANVVHSNTHPPVGILSCNEKLIRNWKTTQLAVRCLSVQEDWLMSVNAMDGTVVMYQ